MIMSVQPVPTSLHFKMRVLYFILLLTSVRNTISVSVPSDDFARKRDLDFGSRSIDTQHEKRFLK
jgi:hypothetical protein